MVLSFLIHVMFIYPIALIGGLYFLYLLMLKFGIISGVAPGMAYNAGVRRLNSAAALMSFDGMGALQGYHGRWGLYPMKVNHEEGTVDLAGGKYDIAVDWAELGEVAGKPFGVFHEGFPALINAPMCQAGSKLVDASTAQRVRADSDDELDETGEVELESSVLVDVSGIQGVMTRSITPQMMRRVQKRAEAMASGDEGMSPLMTALGAILIFAAGAGLATLIFILAGDSGAGGAAPRPTGTIKGAALLLVAAAPFKYKQVLKYINGLR